MNGLGPDNEDPDGKNKVWAKHARKAINNARDVVEKMKGKTQEELRKEIQEVTDVVDKLASRIFRGSYD